MSTWAGPASAVRIGDSDHYLVYMAGRDRKNRSQIGTFRMDLGDLPNVHSLSEQPVLSFSEPGAFDENGVSYPWVVEKNGKTFLYYNGWMPTVLTPFQIQLGLAIQAGEKSFDRVSRAPILERNNFDYLSIGSAGVMLDGEIWRMWYTAFLRWGNAESDHKHYYLIKYAESDDGISWRRDNVTCVDFSNSDEFSICRPSVVKIDGGSHMWYSYRGEYYRIGYAYSDDGIHWSRKDDVVGIDVSPAGWDSQSICYSYVFRHGDHLFMLYCGNDYGKEGLGIARLQLQ